MKIADTSFNYEVIFPVRQPQKPKVDIYVQVRQGNHLYDNAMITFMITF